LNWQKRGAGLKGTSPGIYLGRRAERKNPGPQRLIRTGKRIIGPFKRDREAQIRRGRVNR